MGKRRGGWVGRLNAASAAALLGLSAVIAGCGGGGSGAEPNGAQTFESRAAAWVASSAISSPPATLSATDQAEVQRRSREWAVAALYDPLGGIAVPPLYFGLRFAADAAANGETLAQLRSITPPAEAGVRAALQRDLRRHISAGANTAFATAFLDALMASGHSGTFGELTLLPLQPAELALEPNLLMSVSDRAGTTLAWPQVRVYQGVHAHPNGQHVSVSMLQVTGPMLERAGADYEASSMVFPDGQWLLRIVPASPAAFDADKLSAALAEVVPTLTAQASPSARTGSWHLPQGGSNGLAGSQDGRGMVHARDPARADLRGLGQGGAYLHVAPGTGGLRIVSEGLTYFASQSFDFIFNPLSPLSGGGGGFTNLEPPTLSSCPTEPADVRPYFLALVQPGGNLAMLARQDYPGGSICFVEN